MKLERSFTNGKKSTSILMTIDKGRLETLVRSEDGKEKRDSAEVSKYVFEGYAKLVQKHLKAGLEPAPLKDAPSIADGLLKIKELDLDLSDVLDVFSPAEREAVVKSQVEKAEKAKKVVGPEHGYARASILQKCPTPVLLRHFLSRLHDGSLKYKYDSGGMNGDLQFFATAISNAARDDNNRAWIVEEVNRVLPDAEPDLKNWLKARIAKFKEQAQTKTALATKPKAPAMLEEGLLEAIGKDPTDDAPRQVWADWLQERNHPWGEVVSLQCEREKANDARREAIDERLEKIESRAKTQFLAPIKAFIAEYGIERGLMDRVTVSVDKLIKPGAAEAILLRAPGAELTLTGLKKTHVKDLAKLPVGRFGSLKLGSKPPSEALEALVKSPLVSTVRAIEVWGVDDKTLEALENVGASVRGLTLWYSTASSKGIIALVKALGQQKLEEIHFPFAKDPLARDAVESIASIPTLKQLNVPLAESGCGASLGKLKSLESLSIMTNGHWDDADCIALAKSSAKLKTLDVRASVATVKGASELLRLGASSVRIEYTGNGLDFSKAKPSEGATLVSSKFSDADAAALAKSTFGKKLGYLEIKGSEALGDKGVEALLSLDNLGGSLYVPELIELSAKTTKKLAAFKGE